MMRFRYKVAIIYTIVMAVSVSVFAPAVSAITYFLPELTSAGKGAGLAIGRLGSHDGKENTLPVQMTTVKLIYANVPDSVQIFDGPFCRQSENSIVDNHTFNNACNDGNINYRVHYDFQAINNETGALGPLKRVFGHQLTPLAFSSVSLADLQGVSPSTDGKYFVLLTVSWARPNPVYCTENSTVAQGCYGGTNVFGVMLPRSSDYATYPANNTDVPDVPALAVLATGQGADEWSNLTFEFAPKCNASGAALRQKLAWEDADVGEDNQDYNLSWSLYDMTENPNVPVMTRSGSQLGGQGEYREVLVTFKLNHKYRWVWNRVDKNNGVNLYIPYDGYDYLRSCPSTPPPPPPPPPPSSYSHPYFNVTGGDVSVGQGMSTGGKDCEVDRIPTAGIAAWNRGPANAYLGAGTQYAAYVLNRLQEFSTAQSGAIKPTGLSFANKTGTPADTDAATGYYGGKFDGGSCTEDYFAKAPTTPATPKVDRLLTELADFPDGGNVPNGTAFNRYVDGDLYINSNVRFSGNYPSLNDIPSFTVTVRGNIYVDRGVTQLDGVYIAQPASKTDDKGNFYTCATDSSMPFSPLALNVQLRANCNTSLVINGSVTAKRFWPMRTVGDVAAGPAETINFLPELWMSTKSTVNAVGGGKYDAITGLPPVL